MKKRDKEKIKDNAKKTAKGLEIVWTVGWVLFGLFMIGILVYVGVGLWDAIFAPLFE